MTGEERRRLTGYARDAIQILEHSRVLYAQGQVYFYRVAAVQLRLLLCDTVRRHGKMIPLALAVRLWPGLQLPGLAENYPDQNRLRVEEWLAQPVPDSGVTVQQFIRCMCDQDGGAHVDVRKSGHLPEGFPSAEWIFHLSGIVVIELGLRLVEEDC